MLLEARFAMAMHDAMAGNKRNANAGLGIFGEIEDLKKGHGVAATKYLAPRMEALGELFGSGGVKRIRDAIAYHDNTNVDFSTRDKALLTMVGIADNTAAAEKFMDVFTKVPGNEGLMAKLYDLKKICDPERPEQYSRLLEGIRNKLIENIEKVEKDGIISKKEAETYKYTVINDLNEKTATMGLGPYNAGAFVSDKVACDLDIDETGTVKGATMTIALQRSNFDGAFEDLFGEKLADEHLRKITAKPYGEESDSVKAGEEVKTEGLIMNIEARKVRPGRYNQQDRNAEGLVEATRKAHADAARQLRKNRGDPEAQLRVIQDYFDITPFQLGSIMPQGVSREFFIQNFIDEVLPGEFDVSEKEKEQRREILKRAREAESAGKTRVIEEKPVVDDLRLMEFIEETLGRRSGAVSDYLKGWTVNTVEAIGEEGVVDIENKKLYLTRGARAASMVAPVLIPTLIFSETLRTGNMPEELRGGFLDRLLGRNLVDDRLLKGRDISSLDVEETVWVADGTEEGNKGLRDMLVRTGRVWLAFADGMAGRAREKAFGSNIMDILSPEARRAVLDFAEKEGIFAYGFGLDEHVFVFPQDYTKEKVESFLQRMQAELQKGSDYVVYDISELLQTEGKDQGEIKEDMAAAMNFARIADELARDQGKEVIADKTGNFYRIVVDKSVAGEIDRYRNWEDYQFKGRGIEKFRRDIPPFLMPAGAVRATADSARFVTGNEVLTAAEAVAGQKWREDEIRGMSDEERTEIWERLSPEEREAVTVMAWDNIPRREAENLRKAGRDLEGHQKVLYGLPGINKSMVYVDEEVVFAKKPTAVSDTSMLKSIKGVDWDASRLAMRQRMGEGMKPRFDGAKTRAEAEVIKAEAEAEAARAKARASGTSRDKAEADAAEARAERARKRAAKEYRMIDAYTSYNADDLEDLLAEVLRIPQEERAKLPPEERILMVRGPPADFFIVLINSDGTVRELNVDMMCHADISGMSPETRRRVKNELEMLLTTAGRRTDYVITREGKEVRMFPFKALNSYLGSHELADNYILATSVALFKAFIDKFEDEGYGGENNINEEGIIEAVRIAAQEANNSIDTDKFRRATGGKERVNIALETHLIPAEGIVPEKEAGVQAERTLHRLDAMRSVRDAEIVREDGEVYSTDAGELAARVRVFSDENWMEFRYEDEFNKRERADAERGYEEILKKGEWGEINLDIARSRLRAEIPGAERLPRVEKTPLNVRRFIAPAAGTLLAVPLAFLSSGIWAAMGIAGGYVFAGTIALIAGKYRAGKALEQIFRKYGFGEVRIPPIIRNDLMKEALGSPRGRYEARVLAREKNRIVNDLARTGALKRTEAAPFIVSVLENARSLEEIGTRLGYIANIVNAIGRIGIRDRSVRNEYLGKILNVADFRLFDAVKYRRDVVEERARRLSAFSDIFTVLQPNVANTEEVRRILSALLEGANEAKSRPLINALGAVDKIHIQFLSTAVPLTQRFVILNNMLKYYGRHGGEIDKKIAARELWPVDKYLSNANFLYGKYGAKGLAPRLTVQSAGSKEEVFEALFGADSKQLNREYVRRILRSESVDLEKLKQRVITLDLLGINVYGGEGVSLLDRRMDTLENRADRIDALNEQYGLLGIHRLKVNITNLGMSDRDLVQKAERNEEAMKEARGIEELPPEAAEEEVIEREVIEERKVITAGEMVTRGELKPVMVDEAEFLSRLEIHGEPFKGRNLEGSFLKEHDLLPKFQVEVEGETILLSRMYEVHRGRIAVVGYVRTEALDEAGEPTGRYVYVARSYWRSNSQGIWRYLPFYSMNRSGEGIGHYYKLWSEEALMLPAELQVALDHISRDEKRIKHFDDETRDLIFAGTARKTETFRRVHYGGEDIGTGGPCQWSIYGSDWPKNPGSCLRDFSQRGPGLGKKRIHRT